MKVKFLKPFLNDDDGAGSGSSASVESADTSIDNNVETDTGADNTEVDPEGEGEVAEPPQEQPKQSKEMDSAFAKLRKEKEEYERKTKELESKATQADKWVEDNYGSTHGLHTWDDYQNALAQQRRDEQQKQMEENLQAKGLTLDEVRAILQSDPEYQNVIKQNKEYQEYVQKQQQETAFKEHFNELATEYPDEFKTEKDLDKIPDEQWNKMLEKYKRGYSLLDAYESVNKQEIKKKAADVAKQQTLNNINGKSHIKPNGGNSDVESVTIPPETLALYKKLNPGKTHEQYLEHYKRSLKEE